MFSNQSFLYKLLVNPFKTIQDHVTYVPKKEFWIVLGLLALAYSAQMGSFVSFLFIALGLIFVDVVVIGIQAICIDIAAQWLGHTGKTVTVFYWLGLSWGVYLVSLPLSLLENSGYPLAALTGLISLALFVMLLLLQIHIVKHQYGTSTKRALLIYFLPGLLTLGLAFGFFVLATGTLISLFL